MNFFKNPFVAVILGILIIAGSTLVNTQVKLTEECQQIEDGFYTSASGTKSIYARLDARLDAANGLWSILINHDASAAGSLNAARNSLLAAYEARSIADMYDANKELQSAFDASVNTISGYSLSSTERDALNDYTTAFAGAQKMIDESTYNSDVLTFLRMTFNKFPADILAPLASVEAPALYE